MVYVTDWQKEKWDQIALRKEVVWWWETASWIPEGLTLGPVIQYFHQHRGNSEHHRGRTESWSKRSGITFNSINERLCVNWRISTDKDVYLFSLTDCINFKFAIINMKNADVMLGLTKCSISRSVQIAKELVGPHPEDSVQLWPWVFRKADIKLG